MEVGQVRKGGEEPPPRGLEQVLRVERVYGFPEPGRRGGEGLGVKKRPLSSGAANGRNEPKAVLPGKPNTSNREHSLELPRGGSARRRNPRVLPKRGDRIHSLGL